MQDLSCALQSGHVALLVESQLGFTREVSRLDRRGHARGKRDLSTRRILSAGRRLPLRASPPQWRRSIGIWPRSRGRAALLFALDLAYSPDPEEKVFRFGQPRDVTLRFRVPPHLRNPAEVFRIDSDGVHEVHYHIDGNQLEIVDRACQVAIYVVAAHPGLQTELEAKRQALQAQEKLFQFDPAHKPDDLSQLRALLPAVD